MNFRTAVISLALASFAGCGGYATTGPYGGGGGGGGGRGGGPVGAVTLGPDIRFVSSHNGSQNPAVDTIAVGGTVTWTWSGSLPHSVQSTGSPSFSNSGIKTGSGTYAITFTTPGTYHYDCAVHGSAMTGTVVVQ